MSKIHPSFPAVLEQLRPKRRSAAGARPGVVHDDPHAAKPTIHLFVYNGEGLEERDVASVDELPDPGNIKRTIWINVDGLGDAQTITAIGEKFGLHPLALEDVVHTHQRAKVEDYGNCLFMVARMVELHQRLRSEQLSLFLGSNFVITFQEDPGDCLGHVRERLRKASGNIRTVGADYLAYALLDAVIDGYYPVLEEYGNRLEQEEAMLYGGPTKTSLVPILQLKKDLFLLRRAIWPHRDMMAALSRDEYPQITPATRVYFRDCYDHAAHLLDLTETFREMVSDLRDLYMNVMSNRVNETMRVLALFATVFSPLTFIVGIYGMNFEPISPWNMPELRWYYGYPFSWLLMALTLVASMAFYAWRGWLRIDQRMFSFSRRPHDDEEEPWAMFEVEQKFAVADFTDIESRLRERGVVLSPPIAQADRYFAHPARDFAATDEALRIRQVDDENRITYKGPKLDQLTKTRREIELPLAAGQEQAEQFSELLVALGFSPVAVVRKLRRTGHWEHQGFCVEIALDEVENVGQYLELEISADDRSLAAARVALLDVASQFGLTQVERRSYLELLLNS